MKTYEEMTESIIRKTKERKNKLEARRKRISFIAAAAAMVIVITSIPVGSFIISRRADQPMDTVVGETSEKAVSTAEETVPDTLDQSDNTVRYDVVIKDVKGSIISENGSYGTKEVEINLCSGVGEIEYAEGGQWHDLRAFFLGLFTENADSYQADVVFSNRDTELCHITYGGKADSVGRPNIVCVESKVFIPDSLDYGEIHCYFNILKNGTEVIEDYDTDPYKTVCMNFIRKYGIMMPSYGLQTPQYDYDALTDVFNNSLHDIIYSYVEELYLINDEIDHGILPRDEAKREEMYLMRRIYTNALTLYKAENEAEYEEIIKEFCDNEAGEEYDKNGSYIGKTHFRCDPLDIPNNSLNDNTKDASFLRYVI